MGELGEAVVLSRTAIVRLVDRLEKAGLARREPVPEDRRGAYVVITPEGKATLKRMWPVYSAGIERLFATHATKSMGTALDRMARALAELRERPLGQVFFAARERGKRDLSLRPATPPAAARRGSRA